MRNRGGKWMREANIAENESISLLPRETITCSSDDYYCCKQHPSTFLLHIAVFSNLIFLYRNAAFHMRIIFATFCNMLFAKQNAKPQQNSFINGLFEGWKNISFFRAIVELSEAVH